MLYYIVYAVLLLHGCKVRTKEHNNQATKTVLRIILCLAPPSSLFHLCQKKLLNLPSLSLIITHLVNL
jgi:hypothetical protein